MTIDHLQLVNGIWRVRIEVPVALQPRIGKANLTKSLGTADYDEAYRRSEPHIAEFKARIAHAQRGRFQYHNNIKPRQRYIPDAASRSSEWYTPPIVFEAMGAEFDMDVASPGREVVPWIPARIHLTKNEDGLKTPWEGFVWCNPPYGRRHGMQDWIDKFVAHRNGVIMLPNYTYTQWFQELAVKVDCILFPLFKIHCISRLYTGRSNSTLGNCLCAIGDQGIESLHNAATAGFGKLFVIP
jgi:hypothetical protein